MSSPPPERRTAGTEDCAARHAELGNRVHRFVNSLAVCGHGVLARGVAARRPINLSNILINLSIILKCPLDRCRSEHHSSSAMLWSTMFAGRMKVSAPLLRTLALVGFFIICSINNEVFSSKCQSSAKSM